MTIGEGFFLFYVLVIIGTNLLIALFLTVYISVKFDSLDGYATSLYELVQRLQNNLDFHNLAEDIDITPQLTSYERMRFQREEAFDERIARLKEEIAAKRVAAPYVSTPAEELHPDVHNLPHEIINPYQSKEYVEEVAR